MANAFQSQTNDAGSVLIRAAVPESDGVGKSLPVQGTDNGDGTASLTVDATFTPSGTQNVAITAPLGAQAPAASVAVVGARVTPHPAAMGASVSVVFPIGAQDCSFLLLTGTGTVGGVNWPLLTPYNVRGPLAATLTVATGSASTAICDYSS